MRRFGLKRLLNALNVNVGMPWPGIVILPPQLFFRNDLSCAAGFELYANVEGLLEHRCCSAKSDSNPIECIHARLMRLSFKQSRGLNPTMRNPIRYDFSRTKVYMHLKNPIIMGLTQ